MKTLKIIYRGFKKNRAINLINIASMAIGIAAAIILLSYVYQELNYDAQLPNSARISRVLSGSYGPLAVELKADFPEIEDATRVSLYWGYLALTANSNMFNENKTIFADPNFFTLFSLPFIAGDPSNCLNTPNSIVLSERAARRYFGEKDAIGGQIKIGKDKLFTVHGVFEGFSENSNFQGDIVLPLKIISKLTQMWIEPSWKNGSDIDTFVLASQNANNENISAKIVDYLQIHVKDDPPKLSLQSLKDIHTEVQVGWESTPPVNKRYLYFLVVVALVILTMSAANFLLLYIASSSERTLFTCVKRILGASKFTLFRDHLQEIFVYITISVLFSLILIFLYNSMLAVRFSTLPSINEFNYRLGIGIIFAYAMLTSIVPAIIASSPHSNPLFKQEQQQVYKKPRVINSLVITQFTVSVVLLSITMLFYKQLQFLQHQKLGYAKDELITIPLNMSVDQGLYSDKFDTFAEELKKQHGVQYVTMAFSSPSEVQTSAGEFRCEGMPGGKTVSMHWNSVYYDYFETIGVAFIKGRDFSRKFKNEMVDYDHGNKCSYVINQKAAKEIGLENPIGQELYAYKDGIIVGIVEDINFKSLHSEIKPMCFNMNPFYYNDIIVRVNLNVPGVLKDIEKVWGRFVPEYPIEFSFVNDQIDNMYKSEQRLAFTLNLFSAIAILIACMGLLSLTMLAMQKRTKEIGIRKVNGARIYEILILLNMDFIKWVMIAFVLGCPIAYYAMNLWLENFAYRTALSWWIFLLAGIVSLGIALVTVSWHCWRAATRNPIDALRHE